MKSRPDATAQGLADFLGRHTFFVEFDDSGSGGIRDAGRATKFLPFLSSTLYAKFDPLSNQITLELRKGRKHPEHQFSRWGRRIDGLLVEVELNALGVKIVHGGHEVLERATETVDAPDGDEVEFPSRRCLEHLVERRAPIPSLGSADTIVSKGSDDVPATKSGYTL